MKKSIFVVFSCLLLLGNIMLSSCGEKEKTPTQKPSEDQSQTEQKPNTDVQGGQTSSSDQTQSPDDKDEPSDPEQPNKPSDPKPEDVFSAANAFLEKLDNNNFSYNSGSVQVKRQGDLISYAEPSYVDYYQRSNGQTYTYIFQSSDQKWHKKELDGQDVFAIVDDMIASFQSVQWSAQSGNTYTGSSTLGQLKLTLKDEFSGIFNALGQDVEVFDVGRTVVSLPAVEQVVDESKLQPENPPRPETNKLFEVVNGQKQWNFPLLKDTLQTWMIENDYFSRLCYNTDRKFDEILYLNFLDKEKTIEFYALVKFDGIKIFQPFKTSSDLFDALATNKITTSDELKKYLSSEAGTTGMGNHPVDLAGVGTYYEYSTLDEDYGTHQAEFEKMTQNIFNRLETIGYQSGSINNPGTIVTDYKDAKILFGMKITYSGKVVPGFDMGYVDGWSNCYLLNLNGNVEFVTTKIIADANTSKLPIEYVLDNTNTRKWMISAIETKELQKENLNLYANSTQNKSKE